MIYLYIYIYIYTKDPEEFIEQCKAKVQACQQAPCD